MPTSLFIEDTEGAEAPIDEEVSPETEEVAEEPRDYLLDSAQFKLRIAGERSRAFKERRKAEIEEGLSVFDKNRREKVSEEVAYDEEPNLQNPHWNMLMASTGNPGIDEALEQQEAVPEEEKTFGDKTRGVVNFLFGDEMGILGMKWDKEGFSFAYDNMVDQWAEHPVMSTFAAAGLIAQIAFPVYGAVSKSAKVGKLAEKGVTVGKARSLLREPGRGTAAEIKAMAKANSFLLDESAEAAIKSGAVAQVDKGTYARRIFQRVEDATPDEIIDPATAAAKSAQESAETVSDVHRYFTKEAADEILSGKLTDDEIVKRYGKQWKKMLLGEERINQWAVIQHKAKFGDESIYGAMTRKERMYHTLRTAFGNTYFKQIMQPKGSQIAGWDKFFIASGLPDILDLAPDPKFGKPIVRYLIGADDLTTLKKSGLDEAGIKWAENLGERMTDLQKRMVDEGFLSQEEFDSMANFAYRHITSVKKGTPGGEDLLTPLSKKAAKTRAAGITEHGKAVSSKSDATIGQSFRTRYGKPESAEEMVRGMLDSPSLKKKNVYLTREKYLADIDQMITDPADFTMATLVRDSQLHHGYSFFRDAIMDPDKHAYMVRSSLPTGAAKGNWVKLDDLPVPGASNRILRMTNVARKKKGLDPIGPGDLPYVRKDVIDEFYDPDGFIGQISANHSLLEVLTSIHKTARTALNPATHVQNLAGNLFGFLPMAGYNVLHPFKARERIQDGAVITKVFSEMAKRKSKNALTISEALRTGKQVPRRLSGAELFEPEFLNGAFVRVIDKMKSKGNYYIKDVDGIKRAFLKGDAGDIDLANFFSNKAIINTLEESAFDNIEGFGRLQQVWSDFAKLASDPNWQARPQQWLSAKLAQTFGKLTGFGKGGMSEKSLHAMSSAYLAEDAVPKMMYAIDLQRKGMSMDQVVLEVGRRLPQYQAVGSLVGSARKSVLPWITFPAEATRIMKNNMMDYPLRMLPWMQAPALMQTAIQGLGFGPTSEEFEGQPGVPGVGAMLPKWAHKYSTTIAREGPLGIATGGATGGLVGSVAGVRAGGVKAGLLGGAIGALGGAAAGAAGAQIDMGDKPDDENLRAWVMDYLPQSAALWNPASTSPYAEPSGASFREVQDLLPVEPFAVVMPLIDIMRGEGSFGREIPVDSVTDMASKSVMGLIGFLSPPALQKYGMKVEGQGGLYIPMVDIMDDLGGSQTIGAGQTAHFDEQGGVTVQEAPEVAKILTSTALGAAGGYAAGGLPGAAVGGTLGLAAGKALNNRRLMQDAGLIGNSYTGTPGNPIFDMLFNTFGGLPKSWEVSPQQALINEEFRKKPYDKIRGHYRKGLEDAIESDNESMQRHYLEKIQGTFSRQHLNPEQAQKKFYEWLKRNIKTVGRSRALKNMSEEEIKIQLAAANDFATKTRTKAAEQIILLLQQELMSRKVNTSSQANSRSTNRRSKAKGVTFREPKRRRAGVFSRGGGVF